MGYVVANLILLLSCKENTLTFLDGNISISQTYIVWVMQDFFFLMGQWSFYYYNLLFILFKKENFFFLL